MGDRLDVGRAVAELDEEALVVLEAVGRAGGDEVEPVGVVVLERLADALLEVGGRDDAQVGLGGEAVGLLVAVGIDHYDRVQAEGVGLDNRRQHDLRLVAGAVVREHEPHGIVAPAIRAEGFQWHGDVLDDRVDAERVGHGLADRDRLGRGLALGHVDAEDPFGTERAHRDRGDRARVDPARQGDDDTAPPDVLEVGLQQPADSLGLLLEVELQGLGAELVRIHAVLLSGTRVSMIVIGSAGCASPVACSPPSTTNWRCSSWVEITARMRMLSVLLIRTPCVRRHLATSASTVRGANSPASRTPSGETTSASHSGMAPPEKNADASGARYGCLGRWRMASGITSANARLRMCFSSRPSSLWRAGSAMANSTTSRSRNGKRPSTELAMSMRSPCDARM